MQTNLISHSPYLDTSFRYRKESRCFGLSSPVFGCLEKIKSIGNHVKKFTSSLLGRVALYTVADMTGATVGSYIGRWLGQSTTATAGYYLAPFFPVAGVIWVQNHVNQSFQTSTISKIGTAIITTSTILCAVKFSNDIAEWGESTCFVVGRLAGEIAGTVFGGYLGLVLAGSPILFFDANHPWDSYSISTIRFLAAGILFDGVVVNPSTPFIAPLLRIPRQISRSTVQILAYNSNTLVPAIHECVKHKSLRTKPALSTFAGFMVNSYCGNSAASLSKKLSDSLLSIFISISPIITEGLKNSIQAHNFVTLGLINQAQALIDRGGDLLTSLVVKSLLQYVDFLNSSKLIKQKLETFEKSLFNSSPNAETISGLTTTIFKEISQDSSLLSIFRSAFLPLLQTNLSSWVDTCVLKIQEAEINLVGYPLLRKKQIIYLKTMLNIHLPCYLFFTLSKISELMNPLTTQEQSEILKILNDMLYKHYVKLVCPPFIATTVHEATRLTLRCAFKTQKMISYLLMQAEQRSYLSGSILPQINYVPDFSNPDMTDEEDKKEYVVVENHGRT